MAKPHRTLKKANHGRRPANSKARRRSEPTCERKAGVLAWLVKS